MPLLFWITYHRIDAHRGARAFLALGLALRLDPIGWPPLGVRRLERWQGCASRGRGTHDDVADDGHWRDVADGVSQRAKRSLSAAAVHRGLGLGRRPIVLEELVAINLAQ